MLLFLLFIKNPLHTQVADFSGINVTLPDHYNFLEEYPECDIGPLIQWCGCCYAVSALKSLAHRFCKLTGVPIVFSHQYFINCDVLNSGCDGGNERVVLYYLEQHGIPTVHCHPWQSIKYYKPDVCQKCVDGKSPRFFKAKKRGTKHYIGVDNIKKGIMLDGPVSASLVSDFNFVWYKDGLYRSSANSSHYVNEANHTIIIHGWGKYENGTEYWLVQNAFGERWGQNGLMKMILGFNEGFIESGVFAPTPDLDPVKAADFRVRVLNMTNSTKMDERFLYSDRFMKILDFYLYDKSS